MLKTYEIAVQDDLNCKKARTSNFDDPTTLFKGLERCGRAAEEQVGAHFGCAESKLELRRPPWSPNRLGQCSQCRQYKEKLRPGGQGGMYRAQLGAQEARVGSTDRCTETNLDVLHKLWFAQVAKIRDLLSEH